MNLTEKHALELSDLTAFNEWEDGEGTECATTSGVWFAALAYERARVAKISGDDNLKAGDVCIVAGHPIEGWNGCVVRLLAPCQPDWNCEIIEKPGKRPQICFPSVYLKKQ